MKRVLIFVLLKAIEIPAIVFLPYFIGSLEFTQMVFESPGGGVFGIWAVGLAAGFVLCLIAALAGLFLNLIVALFLKNWEWAGRI